MTVETHRTHKTVRWYAGVCVLVAAALALMPEISTVLGQIESEPLATETSQPSNTATPAPSSTPVFTATVIPTSTPTPYPTATPIPVACQAYRLNVKHQGNNLWSTEGFWHLTKDGGDIKTCLEQKRGLFIQAPPGSLDMDFTTSNVSELLQPTIDNNQLCWEALTYPNPMMVPVALKNFCKSLGWKDDGAVYALIGGLHGVPGSINCTKLDAAFGPSFSICLEGSVYFSHDCNLLPLDTLPTNICDAGYVSWRVSPISLNFTSYKTIAQDMTFTHFPLIPGNSDKWFTWKASSDNPLVVIDPDHTGSITSPYQLLGNWSFGGYGRSLKTMLSKTALPTGDATPWKHGFEALSTLDEDNDGTVQGSELAPLALWFDHNRNGVSEAGEVQTFSQAGVTKLFYRGSTHDDLLDGDLLDVGFERVVDGKLTTGSSFDWFSPGDTNKDRLIAFELGRQLRDIHGNKPKLIKDPFFPTSDFDRAAALNGSWEWLSDAEQNPGEPTIGGILNLVAFKNGELRGMSLSENHYVQPYPVNSVVAFNAFKGSISKSKRIEFNVDNEHWKLQSSAELSPDGSTLIGKTTATQADKKRSLSYTWRATKRIPSLQPK